MVSLVRSMTGDHPGRAVLVLSNDGQAGGLDRARTLGVATAVIDHRDHADRQGFEAALTRALERVAPDAVCLAGFMRILTPGFVGRWRGRLLNIHPSLLPAYPGLNTHQRALDAGDAEAGCTVHLVTENLDAGPILGQARVPVLAGDTARTLAARVLEREHILYPLVLRRFLEGETAPLRL